MFRTTLFILTIGLLTSCQPDQFELLEPSKPAIEMPSEGTSQFDEIHSSILKSDWWQGLSPAVQQFIGPELSNDHETVTWRTLEARMERAQHQVAMRAQACPGFPANPAGDVTLTSQADVNAFGALKCKEITGALLIDDTGSADPICDLTPLTGLKKVGSSLSVISDCLTDLSGLEKLKSVGELGPFGFVGVIGASLTDINALSKLKNVTGSINIISCQQLTAVTDAFSNITTIESGKAPISLTSVFVLNINDNAALTDISAFSSLTYIEGGLRIIANGALQDLDDLSGLNNIGDDIFIVNNAALQNVNELSNITSLQGDLFIFDNPSLVQCCGLYNLLCSNPPACTASGVLGTIIIDLNGAGCTEADIVANGPCP